MKNKEIEKMIQNRIEDIYQSGEYIYQAKELEEILSYIEQLEKEIEEYQKELEKADSITQSCIFNGKKDSEISYRKCLNMLERLKKEKKQLENNRDKARKMIFDNYGVLDKYQIEMLDDILKGDSDD